MRRATRRRRCGRASVCVEQITMCIMYTYNRRRCSTYIHIFTHCNILRMFWFAAVSCRRRRACGREEQGMWLASRRLYATCGYGGHVLAGRHELWKTYKSPNCKSINWEYAVNCTNRVRREVSLEYFKYSQFCTILTKNLTISQCEQRTISHHCIAARYNIYFI